MATESKVTSDLERAVDRIIYAVTDEPTRRISFLIGAGVSQPSVPTTAEMTEIFCRSIGAYCSQLRESIRHLDVSTAYQTAAHELRQRRGESALAKAVQQGVLRARLNESESVGLDDLEDSGWKLPPAHDFLGKLISLIPTQQRGPIFTTNFDPLAEVALRKHGVSNATLATPSSVSIPLDSVFGSLPIVHLHGYWVKSATLSTIDQLNRMRPGVEETLQRHLAQSIMVVVGYSGWEDSFTRALSHVINDGRWSAMEGELLWMSYSRTPGDSSLLGSISGAPGVNTYWGISADDLFSAICVSLADFRRKSRDQYPGWTAVPRIAELGAPSRESIMAFTEGAQPNWEVAGTVPMLDACRQAADALTNMIGQGNDGVVALVGPTGEGKSVALMQLALDAGSRDDGAVLLYRQPSASPITAGWLTHLRGRAACTLLFIDEGDLVISEVFSSHEEVQNGGRIIFVMAVHDHYEPILDDKVRLSRLLLRKAYFGDFGTLDAERIATCWLREQILPPGYSGAGSAAISSMILESGRSKHGQSLFGAVLHLRMGDGLEDRVKNLLEKLERVAIRGKTLRQLLGAIAFVQAAWDLEEEGGFGISLAVLGELCELRARDVLAFVLAPLGREVGLSQIGDRVYVRHPSIALAIVKVMRDSNEAIQCAEMLGEAGGRLRVAQDPERQAFHSSYRLYSQLNGREAVAAARGAVRGAPRLLEPRVSYVAAGRHAGDVVTAAKYVEALMAHELDYTDVKYSIRGLYVERAMIEKVQGHRAAAVGFATASLSDLPASRISADQLRYGLVVAATCCEPLAGLGGPAASLQDAILDLLSVVPGARDRYPPLRKHVLAESVSIIDAVGRFQKFSQSFGGKYVPSGAWKFAGLLDMMTSSYSRKKSDPHM